MKFGRYLLIVLACVPLVILTATTFTALGSGNAGSAAAGVGSPPAQPPVKADEIQSRAAEAILRAKMDGSLAKTLRDADLFAPQAAVSSDAKSSLKGITDDWRQTQTAASLAVRITEILGPRDRAERLRRLQAFLAADRKTFAKVRGADGLFSHLEGLVKEVETQLAAAKKYSQAWRLFSIGQYQDSLATLGEMSAATIEDPKAREAFASSVRKLRQRNELWIDWNKLRQMHRQSQGDLAGLESLHATVGEFLNKYSPPPGGDEEIHASAMRWQASIGTRIDEEKSKRDLVAQISGLSKAANLTSLQDAVRDTSAKITRSTALNDAVKAEHKRLVREAVIRWLTTVAFPRATPPTKLTEDNQEAILGNGRRLIGRFELPSRAIYWKYWRWDGPKDRDALPDGEERSLGQNGFEPGQEPHKPLYLQWSSEYNNTSLSLSQGATKAQWRAFLDRCAAMEKDLAAYRARFKKTLAGLEDKPESPWEEPDQSCRQWRFAPDPAVLPHTDLDELSQRLEQLQRLD